MSSATRVAVTGYGAVSPVGGDAASTWASLVAGRSGVTTIEDDWAVDLPVRIAGRVEAGFEAALNPQQRRRMDRAEQLAMVAGREAWAMAGSPAAESTRVAVVVGTAIGGLHSTLDQQHRLEEGGSRRVSPHTVTMMMANGAAAWLSMAIGARGGARTPVSACASSSEALLMARELIISGAADVVLAGGTEACVTALTLSALAQTKALSPNVDAPRASRPFDRDRDGFVLGEGAALLVCEREEFAQARSARTYGFLVGAALSSDAYDVVAADPDNQARTMSMALRSAAMEPTDVQVVHAHATSTVLGDRNESEAITTAIGTHPAVTSTKSMTGHLLGASGALATVVTLHGLQSGLVPPTTNIDVLDPDVKIDVVANQARQSSATVAMVNAFGFGGHNACLVLARD